MIWCIKIYAIAYVKIQKNIYTIHYVKPTAQLLFKSRFPKRGPTWRRQVVNPRHQTPQGQSIAKPETPLQNIQVELLDDLNWGVEAIFVVGTHLNGLLLVLQFESRSGRRRFYHGIIVTIFSMAMWVVLLFDTLRRYIQRSITFK